MYGEWWIETRQRPPTPYTTPRHTVAGELAADGMHGWTLETIGTPTAGSIWMQMASRAVGSDDDLVTIWGADSSGKSFSLLGCYDIQSIWQSNAIHEGVQRWHVSAIAEGEGIWVDSETLIDQADLELRDLDAWTVDPRDPDMERDLEAESLTFSLSPKLESARAQDCAVELRHGRNWSVSTDTVQASANALLRIHDTLTFGEINDKWVRPLTELMSFLAMRPSFPTSIQARLTSHFGQERPIRVRVRLPQALDDIDLSTSTENIVSRQLEMLASRRVLQDLGVEFGDLLSNWFVLQSDSKLRAALMSLIDSQVKTEGFRFDDSLLYACNSLESMHSSRFDGSVEEHDDIIGIVNRMRKQLSSQERKLLGDRLATVRRKSFSEKVTEIADGCGEAGARLIAAYPEFVTDINSLRNKIAHTTTRPRNVSGQLDVLMAAQWLLRHALLQSLGIPDSTCDRLVLNNNAFGMQMRRLESWHGAAAPSARDSDGIG